MSDTQTAVKSLPCGGGDSGRCRHQVRTDSRYCAAGHVNRNYRLGNIVAAGLASPEKLLAADPFGDNLSDESEEAAQQRMERARTTDNSEAFAELVEDPDLRVRLAALENKSFASNATSKMVSNLMDDPDARVRQATLDSVAANIPWAWDEMLQSPEATTDHIRQAMQGKPTPAWRDLVDDPRLDAECVEMMFESASRSYERAIAYQVAVHPNAPAELRERLLVHEPDSVIAEQHALAVHHEVSNPAALEMLADHPNRRVRQAVATVPATPSHTLDRLADEFPVDVAANPTTTKTTLHRLVNHPDLEVREAVRAVLPVRDVADADPQVRADALSRVPDHLRNGFSNNNGVPAVNYVAFFDDPAPEVRESAARNVRDYWAFRYAANHYDRTPDPAVGRGLAANPDTNVDGQAMMRIIERGDKSVYKAVRKRLREEPEQDRVMQRRLIRRARNAYRKQRRPQRGGLVSQLQRLVRR